MTSIPSYILMFIVLLLLELLYFRIAIYYNIIDKPNHRSSHETLTILGGGIIFPIAIVFYGIINQFEYPYFLLGLFIISFLSFYDDLKPLSHRIRLFVQLVSCTLLFVDSGLINQPILLILLCYIIVIGTINAYNFMDGINGITGSYSLLTSATLWFVNENIFPFVDSDWLIVLMISLLVFSLFNFRKKAKCFAGDVGSVSMAFILIFLILLLIIESNDLRYIGFLMLYGLDSISTIIFRIIRKEDIFDAHRTHFYQHLTNVKRWSHLAVSGLYMLVQTLMSIYVIMFITDWIHLVLFCLGSGIAFVVIRVLVEGKRLLFGSAAETF